MVNMYIFGILFIEYLHITYICRRKEKKPGNFSVSKAETNSQLIKLGYLWSVVAYGWFSLHIAIIG